MFLKNPHRLWVRLLFVIGAVGLFVFGYQWGNEYQRRNAEPPRIDGVLIRPPAAIPGFRLQDPIGRAFDQETLATGWTLLTFADLSSADGHLAIQRLIDAYNRVAEREDLHEALRLALVTTTDMPNLARDFSAMTPALFVLSGEPAETARLRDALGVTGDEPPPLFVFGPGGYLLALLPAGADGAAVARDLTAIHERAFFLLPEEP
jgi:hypothetical protein